MLLTLNVLLTGTAIIAVTYCLKGNRTMRYGNSRDQRTAATATATTNSFNRCIDMIDMIQTVIYGKS